jgi:hypothetical protein
MIFTADQIVAHLVGDYILQSHWMATEKTKKSLPAMVHAACYSMPFVLITQSIPALIIILASHFVIDRFRLARFVVWVKNGPWNALTSTGYPDNTPPWLAVWLLIIADNTIHICINGLAIWSFQK